MIGRGQRRDLLDLALAEIGRGPDRVQGHPFGRDDVEIDRPRKATGFLETRLRRSPGAVRAGPIDRRIGSDHERARIRRRRQFGRAQAIF